LWAMGFLRPGQTAADHHLIAIMATLDFDRRQSTKLGNN